MSLPEENSHGIETLVRQTFAAIQAKDLDGLLALFADDAVLIDPHFEEPRMEGKVAIAKGLREAFAGVKSFEYVLGQYFEATHGQTAAVELGTHHNISGNFTVDFPQVFIFEAMSGRIVRMQAYEPYGPHGTLGMFLLLGRLVNRFKGLPIRFVKRWVPSTR